eukprot:4938448-Prymnesium_polylepis.11
MEAVKAAAERVADRGAVMEVASRGAATKVAPRAACTVVAVYAVAVRTAERVGMQAAEVAAEHLAAAPVVAARLEARAAMVDEEAVQAAVRLEEQGVWKGAMAEPKVVVQAAGALEALAAETTVAATWGELVVGRAAKGVERGSEMVQSGKVGSL